MSKTQEDFNLAVADALSILGLPANYVRELISIAEEIAETTSA